MTKNFYLYWGLKLVTAVNCEENTSHAQIIQKALNTHDVCPCVSALYPRYSPYTIRQLICLSNVVE